MTDRNVDDGMKHAGLLPDARERDEAREAKEREAKQRQRPMFFLVQREGVYGRGVVGIFTTEPKAEEAARAAADEEHDAWHAFACYAVQSNMRVTLAYSCIDRDRERDPAVFVLRRKLRESGGYENVVERAP